MNIPIKFKNDDGNYAIRTDSLQYIFSKVFKTKICEKTPNGLEYRNIAFFKKLESLYEFLLDWKIKQSDATSFNELIQDVKNIKKELETIFDWDKI